MSHALKDDLQAHSYPAIHQAAFAARVSSKRSTTFTFNAASDVYDEAALGFRDYFGRKTVENLNIRKGARVLDVCSGTGSSAIPAAETVGASGFVIGVDLADRLLALAREKARQRALQNITFRVGDMLELDYQAASFDAVLCVFGIFFVPDMPAAVRKLWRLVRPGGKLAITSWGGNVLEPANSMFWRSVRDCDRSCPSLLSPGTASRVLRLCARCCEKRAWNQRR